MGEGSFAKILINVPGFSLAYAWHKSDFPLPLHSHDVDCCYLIVAGELKVGSEALGKGDGFFVPAGTPYTFTTGPEGVEFIEYRHANSWNIVFKYRNAESWAKAASTASDRRETVARRTTAIRTRRSDCCPLTSDAAHMTRVPCVSNQCGAQAGPVTRKVVNGDGRRNVAPTPVKASCAWREK